MMKRKRPGQDGSAKKEKVGSGGSTPASAPKAGEIVSYGILLYKRGINCERTTTTTTTTNDHDNNDNNQKPQQRQQQVEKHDDEIRFLLGLIPQRNWWTVFKGLPDTNEQGVVVESPHETALREFQEETSIAWTGTLLNPELTLHGHVGAGKNKKKLVIYLVQDGSGDNCNCISTNQFDVSKVVKIDSGYMKGQAEIVAIQWLSYHQAMNGIMSADTNNKLAKIYTSQRGILEEAYKYLTTGKT
jgi:8-oxo-dGTP pyrophosphatase MutT (NUDIX family)